MCFASLSLDCTVANLQFSSNRSHGATKITSLFDPRMPFG
jgi:hypothetical protein